MARNPTASKTRLLMPFSIPRFKSGYFHSGPVWLKNQNVTPDILRQYQSEDFEMAHGIRVLATAIVTILWISGAVQSGQTTSSKRPHLEISNLDYTPSRANNRRDESTPSHMDRKRPLNTGCSQHFSPSNGGGCSY
jgi:hypothetical protein